MSNSETPEGQDQEWLGLAAYRGSLYAITGILAEFILDYRAYDPEWSATPDAAAFRGGVLTATADNAPRFLPAMRARSLTAPEAQALGGSGAGEPDLLAFIDFEARRYVHSYYDLPLEKYIPKGWRGALGDPKAALLQWLARP